MKNKIIDLMSKPSKEDKQRMEKWAKKREARLLSKAIEEEGTALHEYEEKLDSDLSEKTCEILEEIIADEKEHLLMLQARLAEVDKIEASEDGIKPAKELFLGAKKAAEGETDEEEED